MINIDVINECITKKLPFPKAIERLHEIGIERYYADLTRMEKIYYSHNGDSYTERMTVENLPKIADTFNENELIHALRSVQKGEIDYHSFLRKILGAGIVSYTVYIDGKQVIYVSRRGEAYAEKFPF